MSETSDVKKGFNVTLGIIFALFVVFIVLPMGACVGCVALGSFAGGVAEEHEKQIAEDESM